MSPNSIRYLQKQHQYSGRRKNNGVNSITILGLVVSCGFVLGELATIVRLPKVLGYIVAGLMLNPSITGILPASFIHRTAIPTDIALSFITFAVGGTLSWGKLKRMGRSILFITFFESQTALIFTLAGLAIFGWLSGAVPYHSWLHTVLPMAMLLGALACPTDPSATLAVIHQYHAKGKITSSILGVAGLDDIAGLVNFTLLSSIALVLLTGVSPDVPNLIGTLGRSISGALLSGTLFGGAITLGLRLLRRETEGAQIVVIFASLMLCFGVSKALHFEALLATMAAGAFVTNFSSYQEKAFAMLERYTDEIIFVFFFTVSAMQLDVKLLSGSLFTILLFILFRFCGKVCGTLIGGTLSGEKMRNSLLISLGLFPQGGIVIGLALTLAARQQFRLVGNTLLAVIIGATMVHEITGPLLASLALRLSGEIDPAVKPTGSVHLEHTQKRLLH
jgi:Kef-type K+ transport system membrane component KefB